MEEHLVKGEEEFLRRHLLGSSLFRCHFGNSFTQYGKRWSYLHRNVLDRGGVLCSLVPLHFVECPEFGFEGHVLGHTIIDLSLWGRIAGLANCSVAVPRPASRAMRLQSSLSMLWRWSVACRAQPSACQPSGSNRASQTVCELLEKTEQRDSEEETGIYERMRSILDHVVSDTVKHGAFGSARSHPLAAGAMCPPGSTRDDAACVQLRSCGCSVLWNLRFRAVRTTLVNARCARRTLPNAKLISGACRAPHVTVFFASLRPPPGRPVLKRRRRKKTCGSAFVQKTSNQAKAPVIDRLEKQLASPLKQASETYQVSHKPSVPVAPEWPSGAGLSELERAGLPASHRRAASSNV